MQVKSVTELKAYIEQKVQDALKEHVALNIKSTEVEMVEKNVYAVYSDPPVIYKRRMYDGGLADPDNMEIIIRGTTLIIKNTTPPNPEMYMDDGCPTVVPNDLVALVEYGDHSSGGEYTHKHTSKPEGATFLAPRPFIQPTIEEVDRGKQHVNGLVYGLMRAGLKVVRH